MADVRTLEAPTTLSQRILRWQHVSENYAAFVAAIFLQNVKEQSDDHLDFFITFTWMAINKNH
jgi:hypothetical protein